MDIKRIIEILISSFMSSQRFYDSEGAGREVLKLVFLFNLISTYLDCCPNCNVERAALSPWA